MPKQTNTIANYALQANIINLYDLQRQKWQKLKKKPFYTTKGSNDAEVLARFSLSREILGDES